MSEEALIELIRTMPKFDPMNTHEWRLIWMKAFENLTAIIYRHHKRLHRFDDLNRQISDLKERLATTESALAKVRGEA